MRRPALSWPSGVLYMSRMADVDRLRADLRHVLDQAQEWLVDLTKSSTAVSHQEHQELGLAEDIYALSRLRTRAASSLINVALLGGFSSGKSFLLSGLQRGTELRQVSLGDGSTADKYIGLLPSAPTPTTACPATVIPVEANGQRDATGRGFLRVRFAGTEDYEDIGNSLPPPMVAAYAMQQTDVTARLDQHWNRDVAEIEISYQATYYPRNCTTCPVMVLPTPSTTRWCAVRWLMRTASST